ncbi:MAG: enoyl-CoA hydratase/isomerase family protein [Acidimicrobiales bacterium]
MSAVLAGDDLGTPHLRFERKGVYAWCTIDRPEARNALTPAMYFGLRRAVDLVNRDNELRILIVTGTGDVFAPGGEMSGRHQDASLDMADLVGNDILPFRAMLQSRAPVVCAVNGLCQGGGLNLAMAADVAVASRRATFRGPELLRGVADSWYASLMPGHIGVARTRELMFTGRVFDAEEAHRIGLIARLVDHDQLVAASEQVGREILRSAPGARQQFKRMMNLHFTPVDEVTFDTSVWGPEAREGFQAFTERRRPSWVPPELFGDERL